MGDSQEIVVEVDVEPVENRIPIVDLLPEIARGMAEEARRAEADPNISQEVEAKFRTATRLAERLAQEIQGVQAIAPGMALFAGRPPRPVRPDRPDRPNPPNRPGRPPQR